MKNLIRKLIYSIIDISTFYRGITKNINGFNIKFQPIWSRYYERNYEQNTFSFFKKNIKKGDVILDIGAHIGLYSVPFSKLTGEKGKVFCFEPTPSTFEVLVKTIKLNKLENVTAINAAILDKSGIVKFNLTSENGEGSNANSIVGISKTMNSVAVKGFSIDDFKEKNNLKIDILKIDVEGAEFSALIGAKNTFSIDKPSGILALHPANILEFGHSLDEIWEQLEEYKMLITYEGKAITKDYFCSQKLLFDIEFRPLA